MIKNVTVEEVNAALKAAAEGELKRYSWITTKMPLVSIDYNGNTASSTVDGYLQWLLEGNMVKVLSWYDNETGYSNRVVDLASYMARKGL